MELDGLIPGLAQARAVLLIIPNPCSVTPYNVDTRNEENLVACMKQKKKVQKSMVTNARVYLWRSGADGPSAVKLN